MLGRLGQPLAQKRVNGNTKLCMTNIRIISTRTKHCLGFSASLQKLCRRIFLAVYQTGQIAVATTAPMVGGPIGKPPQWAAEFGEGR